MLPTRRTVDNVVFTDALDVTYRVPDGTRADAERLTAISEPTSYVVVATRLDLQFDPTTPHQSVTLCQRVRSAHETSR
jgi:hypothetical protein